MAKTPIVPYRLILVTKGSKYESSRELPFTTDSITAAVAHAEGYLLTGDDDEEIHINDQKGNWWGTVTSSYKSPWLP